MALQEGGEEGGGQLLGMDIGDTLYSWDGHLVDFYLLQIHICAICIISISGGNIFWSAVLEGITGKGEEVHTCAPR